MLIAGATTISTNTVTAQEVSNGAQISFTKETHDYGTIKNGANGTCTFEFKNTGNAPLILSNAKGSCGCTVPTWPREPIAAGDSSKIKVKYATNRVGAFSKSITLTSNAINAPKKVIKIKGKVNPDSSTKTENKTEVKS